MVLAAGRGERMRPLTESVAKPALPLLGLPIATRILLQLRGLGVERFALNAWHAPDSLRAAIARAGLGPGGAELFVEAELMGTAGGLDAPRGLLGGADVFVLHNGDTLLPGLDLEPLLQAARGPGRAGALLVGRPPLPGYNAVAVGGGEWLGLASERPDAAPATYLGVGVLRREVLERVPRGRPSELFRDVLLPLLAQGSRIAAVEHAGAWIEFTSAQAYRRHLVSLVLSGRAAGSLDLPGGAAHVRRRGGGAYFAADAELSAGVLVEGGAVLEAGASAARGSLLFGSVLLEGASVASRALLQGVVVARGARVPAGAALRDEVVAP